MLIPKKAIEKAVEGGWDCKGELDGKGLGTPRWEVETSRTLIIHKVVIGFGGDPTRLSVGVSVYEVALDKTFWQALGKSCGFYPTHIEMGKNWNMEQWQEVAHRFYDLVLKEKDTKEFWDTLLVDKK